MNSVAIQDRKDLRAYNLAYQLVMEICEVTKSFSREEIYSLSERL